MAYGMMYQKDLIAAQRIQEKISQRDVRQTAWNFVNDWVGVVFCGRQSPGGHNVICGLYDAMKLHNPKSTLIGFCGGYDLLGRRKDQIRTTEQVNAALASCQKLNLDGLVIIGGVTSNTDAAQLAETFAEKKCSKKVVGVPVTFYGDLKNQFVEADVGFDTICKVNSLYVD